MASRKNVGIDVETVMELLREIKELKATIKGMTEAVDKQKAVCEACMEDLRFSAERERKQAEEAETTELRAYHEARAEKAEEFAGIYETQTRALENLF